MLSINEASVKSGREAQMKQVQSVVYSQIAAFDSLRMLTVCFLSDVQLLDAMHQHKETTRLLTIQHSNAGSYGRESCGCCVSGVCLTNLPRCVCFHERHHVKDDHTFCGYTDTRQAGAELRESSNCQSFHPIMLLSRHVESPSLSIFSRS